MHGVSVPFLKRAAQYVSNDARPFRIQRDKDTVGSIISLTALGLFGVGCGTPPVAPLDARFNEHAFVQFSGGIIELVAEGVSLGAAATVKLVVGQDSTDGRVIDEHTIAIPIPALMSGVYAAVVEVDGFTRHEIVLTVIGQVRPARPLMHASTNTRWGMPIAEGRAIAMEEVEGLDGKTGLVEINLVFGTTTTVVERSGANIVKMYAPGPSYRARHFVFDVSPAESLEPSLWLRDATGYRPVATIACGHSRGSYTAAELPNGNCVSLFQSQLWRNGTPLLSPQDGLDRAEIRLAPGGRWAVPVTRMASEFRTFESLPVLDAAGEVTAELRGYVRAQGAAFSPAGDTLFLVGQRSDDLTQGWYVDVIDPQSGVRLNSREIRLNGVLNDILVDADDAKIYVAAAREIERGRYQLSLITLRYPTLEFLVEITAAQEHSVADSPAYLVPGEPGGGVHLLAWCGFDCGGHHDYWFQTRLPDHP